MDRATYPINHFQAWAYSSREHWARNKDLKTFEMPLGRISHMGEKSAVELVLK
jgi:hypothetical protein